MSQVAHKWSYRSRRNSCGGGLGDTTGDTLYSGSLIISYYTKKQQQKQTNKQNKKTKTKKVLNEHIQ